MRFVIFLINEYWIGLQFDERRLSYRLRNTCFYYLTLCHNYSKLTLWTGRARFGHTQCCVPAILSEEPTAVSPSEQPLPELLIKELLSRRSRQRERLSASMLSIYSSVCLFVAKMQKTRFPQKLSNLERWSLLTTYRKS